MAERAQLDLRGGWVVDGAGGPPHRADVAVRDGAIVAVGRLPGGDAEVIDCDGLLLLPGFVDAHSHADGVLDRDDVQLALLSQGVTSVILGQDGLSFAPAGAATLDYVGAYFGAVNGPGERFAPAPVTVAALLQTYRGRTGVNYGYLVPHGNLRLEVIGAEPRAASDAEVAQMRDLLRAGLADGALGMSTGLEYAPGASADAAELAALAAGVAEVGGVWATHMRGYEAASDSAMEESVAVARASGAALHVSHYHGPVHLLSGLVDDARASGVDVTFDTYPYRHGSSILAMVALPAWAHEGGPAATLSRLSDPAVRTRLRDEIAGARADALARGRLSLVGAEQLRWCEGLSVAQAAERAGQELVEFLCQLLVESELQVGCVFPHPATHAEADLRGLLRHPAHMAGSDGLYVGGVPHPRAWGTFARFLARHVRELGDYDWAAAAVHLSSHAARRFGLGARGLIRPGFVADVVALDPDEISDEATFEQPTRPAKGVRHVWVAGVPVLRDGDLTGAVPGAALTRLS
ncbi:MAG TPA: amidohydrolase family protein [Egibacteraceae bacterium]|nr:amidohydrolase family protein [Egibacteraceae bacterium]